MSFCIACDSSSTGCERCRGGPGEQGFSHDEQELLRLRDRVTELEGQCRSTWNEAIEAAAVRVDQALIVPGLAAEVRALRRAS